MEIRRSRDVGETFSFRRRSHRMHRIRRRRNCSPIHFRFDAGVVAFLQTVGVHQAVNTSYEDFPDLRRLVASPFFQQALIQGQGLFVSSSV